MLRHAKTRFGARLIIQNCRTNHEEPNCSRTKYFFFYHKYVLFCFQYLLSLLSLSEYPLALSLSEYFPLYLLYLSLWPFLTYCFSLALQWISEGPIVLDQWWVQQKSSGCRGYGFSRHNTTQYIRLPTNVMKPNIKKTMPRILKRENISFFICCMNYFSKTVMVRSVSRYLPIDNTIKILYCIFQLR